MDGAWVDGGGFKAELGAAEASSFTLAARRCEHSDGAEAGEEEEEEEEAEAGVDPPLVEQLRPLAATELLRRVEAGGAGERAARGKGELLLQAARACGERRVSRWQGHALPPRLADALLHELRGLRWPAKSQRDELTSEHYLVLKPAAEADCSYATLRRLCAEVMAFAEPEYKYSGVAVTHNFVGSPHIDHCDTTYQFALALGDFEGGELCVEQDEQTVCAVDTKGRIACVDGRYVHWVRTHRGGDRFSLIFYDTTVDVL
ncbi:hypothetical protein AB1Y20_014851 [Prymnesium parvum]